MKPIFVETLWSEAGGDLDTRQVWAFHAFELAAAKEAMAHTSGGYLKTNVNVLFDNGTRIQMRLDLAPHDTHGVRHHVGRYLEHLDTPRGRDLYNQADPASRAFYDALRAIRVDDTTA